MQEVKNSYKREIFCIIGLAGGLTSAAWTLVFSFGNPVRFFRDAPYVGYVLIWLLSAFLPGAISAAIFAPFYFRGMLIDARNGINQNKKAAVLGMCIGGLSCVIFPISSAVMAGVTEGFDQLGDQKVLFVVAIFSFFLVLPAMLVGALLGGFLEAMVRKHRGMAQESN